jgi:hypothetical protein
MPGRACVPLLSFVVSLAAPALAAAQEGDEAKPEKASGKKAGVSASAEGEASASADAAVETESDAAEDEPAVPDGAAERGTPLERETQAAETEAGRSVERWPASAYPEPKIRGLHGGSLWLTFHGLQWPYAPQITGEPDTRFGLSGSVWIDTGYKEVESTNTNILKETRWLQEGRFVLRASPTYSSGPWFVQGQAELVAGKDQTAVPRVDADDVWVRAGKWNAFDVQAGRFEAWEIYHYGMGLDLYTLERRGAEVGGSTPPGIYGANFMYERPADVGNLAAHVYPTEFLRFELLGQVGNTGLNTFGVRPAAVFDIGWVKVKAAAEYRKQSALSDLSEQESEAKGGAAAIQFVIDPHVEFGLNGGYGIDDNFSSTGEHELARSFTRMSGGGFVNGRVVPNLLVGAGANYTKYEDIQTDPTGRVGEFDHIQAFGAVQYLFLEQLFVKAVFGWANALFAPSFTDDSYENTMLSVRVRAMYLF